MTSAQVDVRRASRGDLPDMAHTLADAFADDPVLSYLLPADVRNRQERLRSFFALELPRSLKHSGAWTAADRTASAIWYPPQRWREPTWLTVWHGPASLRVFGRRLGSASQVLARLLSHHPREPHWYLFYLGTVPRAQGTGRGSALLRAVLTQCDAQRFPAYLEATSSRNRELYRRHGFRDLEVLPLPGGGPPFYPMWRDPVA